MLFHRFRRRLEAAYAVILFAALTAPAYAAGSNMPWEQPLTQILNSIQGPVAKVVSVIVKMAGAAVTSIVSLMLPGSNERSTRVVVFTTTSTFVRVSFLKPWDSTLTV